MKERIDLLLVERRLTDSRTKAQWLIRNGFVLVNDIKVFKPGKRVENTSKITLTKEFPYVGRGGLKLEHAIRQFSISIKNKICVDMGASIGGFTDCLLKHGAQKVYAIDTAKDLLHPSLTCEKKKKKVIPLLGVDVRQPISIEDKVDIVTTDITFASLKSILPNAKSFIKSNGIIISLVKPLFEMEFHHISKFKIIQDPENLKRILLDLIDWCKQNEIYPHGIIKSPLLGKGRSVEFFIIFKNYKSAQDIDYLKELDLLLN
ncbi:MAG: TlyA family RNA methyltransferase [Promethearchaeota archaeon]